MTDISADAFRRYLLGAATEEESAAIEIEYLRREPVLDRVAAIEDELIEEFLAGELAPADRDRFERVYLTSPVHRRRVDIMRRLSSTSPAASVSTPHVRQSGRWLGALALAAGVVLAVGGVWWTWMAPGRRGAVGRSGQPSASIEHREPEQRPDRPASVPRIFAVTLSPLVTRSADDALRVVIPAGTDIVALDLEMEAGVDVPLPARADLRTASGDQVWQGEAVRPPLGAAPAIVARIEVPASLLRAEDYVVALFGSGPNGSGVERARYVLHVRDR